MSGSHVRMIGAGLIEAMAYCIAASVEMIAVGTWSDMKPVLIFDVLSGGLIRVFGVKGPAVGQLSGPSGIRFTPDGEHLLISEHSNDRLSLFTLTGKFVACGGVGTLNRPSDVDFASNGDILVADWFRHRVCVFSPDGGDLLRTFGSEEETSTVNFKYPTALAMHGGQLFLLDGESEQVQVFD